MARGGLPAYPSAQIEAVIALCGDLSQRWNLAPHRILAHSDIAPERKEDPGEHFPWAQLASAGKVAGGGTLTLSRNCAVTVIGSPSFSHRCATKVRT